MLIIELGLSDFCLDGFDELTHLCNFLVCSHNTFKYKVFGNAVCTCFNHINLFLGTCDCEEHFALVTFSFSGVNNNFSINKTNCCTSDRTCKGNRRDRDCNGCTYHSCYNGIVIRLNTHNCCYNCNIVTKVLGEKRTDGTVDTS